MKLEELKAEAEKHGYRLTKKCEYVRLKPCPRCGSNRRGHWHVISGQGKSFYECEKCGFRGGNGTSKRKARIAWNEAVEKAGDAE